jgi:hypothetical protein
VWVLAFWRLVECIFDFYVFAVLKEWKEKGNEELPPYHHNGRYSSRCCFTIGYSINIFVLYSCSFPIQIICKRLTLFTKSNFWTFIPKIEKNEASSHNVAPQSPVNKFQRTWVFTMRWPEGHGIATSFYPYLISIT